MLSPSVMDAFYPIVSLLAFLSGCCFGCYYAWQSDAPRRIVPMRRRRGDRHEVAVDDAEPVRKAA